MSYVLPQVLVFQEFQTQPTALQQPLSACIVGPNYELHRYSVAAEKTGIKVTDNYDYTQEVCYNWPNRPVGGEVDTSYTKVYIDNALLKYFHDAIGTDSEIKAVTGYRNRVRSDSVVFKTANGVTRDASLYRDVTVGDTVRLLAAPCGEVVEYQSTVIGFAAEVVAAVVAAATSDANNQGAASASTSHSQTAGSINNVDVDTVNGASYDGLADDAVSEEYTIEVISSSTGGDATTGILRVTSASGLDNVSSVVPAAFSSPTTIGTRGLTVTFHNSSGSSSTPSVDPDDFLVGQKWVVSVTQDYTATSETSGGTYSGTTDTTYIVEVTTGAAWADSPKVTVSTTTGVDVSGPTTVDDGVAFSVGSKGVTLTLTGGTGLVLGDRFYVPVTAEADGAVQTLIFANNLPTEFIGWCGGSSSIPYPDLDMKLFITKNIEVPANRTGFAPLVNWSQTATQICLKDGIVSYDSNWTSGGVQLPLEVYDGEVYVEHRDLLAASCGVVSSVEESSEVEDSLGTVHPDNPLAFGVYNALLNSNGEAVKYVATCGTDLADWNEALSLLTGRNDVYGLVPLSQDITVLQAFAAHAANESTETNGRWRVAWGSLAAEEVKAVYTEHDDEDPLLATIEDDPDTTGTQYTLVTVVDGELITNGVRAGDVLRAQYVSDGFGNYTYSEYVIDAVVSEEECRLVSGPSAPITVASKVEFHRNLTKQELSDELAQKPGLFASRRFYLVWPDTLGNGGTTFPGYFLCCALSGLRSGVLPHQGLTNVAILGFDDVSRTVDYFSASQLNDMAESGWWIVTQDPETGEIYTRHQLSTDVTDLNSKEQNITSNLDSISYVFLSALKEYIGKGNVTNTMLNILRTECQNIIDTYSNTVTVDRLGPQVISGEISKLEVHATLKDRVVIYIDLDLPEPLNNVELHLVV